VGADYPSALLLQPLEALPNNSLGEFVEFFPWFRIEGLKEARIGTPVSPLPYDNQFRWDCPSDYSKGYPRESPAKTCTMSGTKRHPNTESETVTGIERVSSPHKFAHTPTLLPGDFTVPSNHLLGLQTSASSPQIFLFLRHV
jgi:hypothetical protein